MLFLALHDPKQEDVPAPDASTAPAAATPVAGAGTAVLLAGTGTHGGYTATISLNGGGLAHVKLDREQYRQGDRVAELSEKSRGLVQTGVIDAAKFAPGLYDVVETWSPAYFPADLDFQALEWPKAKAGTITRLVRAEAGVTFDPKSPLVVTLSAKSEGDLDLRPGDRLVVGEHSSVIKELRADAVVVDVGLPAGTARAKVVRVATPADQWQADRTFTVVARGEGSVTLAWPNPARDDSLVYVERTWTVKGDYMFAHAVRVKNHGPDALSVQYAMAVHSWVDPWAEPPGLFTAPVKHWAPVCHVDGEVTEEAHASLLESDGQAVTQTGTVRWFGVNSQYFLLAGLVGGDEGLSGTCVLSAEGNGVVSATLAKGNEFLEGTAAACLPEWFPADRREGRLTCTEAKAKLGVDDAHLDAASLDRAIDTYKGPRDEAVTLKTMLVAQTKQASAAALDVTFFAGPKELKLLQTTAGSFVETLDFWYVGFLARPMLWLLKEIHGLFDIWWLAIVLLTLIVRGVMLPLTHRQAVQMQKMQDLKPELDELNKKWANDKQRLQQEMLNVYKRAGVNPLGGCFPILLQMPVYIALYRCIYSAVDLYQAPLFGWVYDMTRPDPYYVLPALLGVFMVIQQRFMPQSPGADPMQQKIMLYVMPLMFASFMLVLPAGLVFYIFVSTVVGVVQQWWVKKHLGGRTLPAKGGRR